MHRTGTDPLDVQMSDVLCDFCGRAWVESIPMIEGHHGACICGRCLTLAYESVVNAGVDDGGGAFPCRMCLETRSDPGFRSPIELEFAAEGAEAAPVAAMVCLRCIKLAARALEKDPESGWTRPTPAAGGS